MLINDLISALVPHHTAEDKFGDGRLGGTACGFPPCLAPSEGGGGGGGGGWGTASKRQSRAVI